MKQGERYSATYRLKCEEVRADVISAINNTICAGTWRDGITRQELHEIVFTNLGIAVEEIKFYNELRTVIGEEIKNIFNQDLRQMVKFGRVRGYYGIKLKENI